MHGVLSYLLHNLMPTVPGKCEKQDEQGSEIRYSLQWAVFYFYPTFYFLFLYKDFSHRVSGRPCVISSLPIAVYKFIGGMVFDHTYILLKINGNNKNCLSLCNTLGLFRVR